MFFAVSECRVEHEGGKHEWWGYTCRNPTLSSTWPGSVQVLGLFWIWQTKVSWLKLFIKTAKAHLCIAGRQPTNWHISFQHLVKMLRKTKWGNLPLCRPDRSRKNGSSVCSDYSELSDKKLFKVLSNILKYQYIKYYKFAILEIIAISCTLKSQDLILQHVCLCVLISCLCC